MEPCGIAAEKRHSLATVFAVLALAGANRTPSMAWRVGWKDIEGIENIRTPTISNSMKLW
jgi:hypothetical protein